jgi:hypothetical protein
MVGNFDSPVNVRFSEQHIYSLKWIADFPRKSAVMILRSGFWFEDDLSQQSNSPIGSQ